MKNYNIKKVKELPVIALDKGIDKTLLGDSLGLTGMEVSYNTLDPNSSLSYIHSHIENEEIFYIISGNGTMFIDGDEFEIGDNDIVKVNPKGKRTLRANDRGLVYLCVQARENSLNQKLRDDSQRHPDTKTSWF